MERIVNQTIGDLRCLKLELMGYVPEVVSMVHKDVVVGCLGAGVAGYLTYRTIKHLLIRQHVHRLRSENQAALTRQTEQIRGLVNECGYSKEEL